MMQKVLKEYLTKSGITEPKILPLFFLKISSEKIKSLNLSIGDSGGISFAYVVIPEGLDNEYSSILALKVAIHELYHTTGTSEISVVLDDITDTVKIQRVIGGSFLNENRRSYNGGLLEEGGAVEMERLFEKSYLPTIDAKKREEYLYDSRKMESVIREYNGDEENEPQYYRIVHASKRAYSGDRILILGTKNYMESNHVFQILQKTIPNFNVLLEKDFRRDGSFFPLYKAIEKVFGKELANDIINAGVEDANGLYKKMKVKIEELNYEL